MSNNKIILGGCIDIFKKNNELLTDASETFELFSITQTTKSHDLDFEIILNSVVDGGNDGGIDSIIVLVDDYAPFSLEDLSDLTFNKKTEVSIIISQCKNENSFKEATLDKLITTVPELFNLSKTEDELLIRFNSDIVDRALIAREAWKSCTIAGGKLKITFNYCCAADSIEINGPFRSKIEQLKADTRKNFTGAQVDYANYSSSELLKLYQTQKSQRFSIPYKESPLSTSYKEYGIGYVGTVKLGDYVDFLKDEDGSIREDIFESNVRHFQGTVDVNNKIKESIDRPNKEDFWWLNNGITIIANKPSLVGTILSVDDVQIVNGLQTSYTIFKNHDGNKEDTRSVLVKVLINEDKSTIDHIIASTNSQNPVSPALLRATDEVQRDIEMYFVTEGYFYDRRKNFYKNQSKPVGRIFSIQTAAQAVESIIFSNPASARSKPTSLIKEDSTYNRIFSRRTSYKAYLNSCLLLKKAFDYWGTVTDREIKIKLSNFRMHLSRIATSYMLNSANVTADAITNIDLDAFTLDVFNKSIELMLQSIDEYQSNNVHANLINMAKSKGVSDVMISKLREELDNV